jgi:hypothetical protein|tara:strand:+ start:235 stop:369 length:135 start_codon:yes stop_codon:yes gene_type:complete
VSLRGKPVDYGTQEDEWRDEYEDYDWDEDRMIKYRSGEKKLKYE